MSAEPRRKKLPKMKGIHLCGDMRQAVLCCKQMQRSAGVLAV